MKINSDTDPVIDRHQSREAETYFGRDLAARLNVSRVPTVIILNQDGEENSRITGVDSGYEAKLLNSIVSAKLSLRMRPPAETSIVATSRAVSSKEGTLGIPTVSLLAAGFVVLYRIRQKRRATIIYELDSKNTPEFVRIQQAFEKLATANTIWRVTSRIPTYDWKRNAGSGTLIDRRRVHCGALAIPNVSTNIQIIGLDLGDTRIYPLPDLVLYWQSRRFAPINYSDLRASWHPSKFIETETVSPDAAVVGKTWRYINKDGSPDRRFNGNILIPIVAYAAVTLETTTGVNLDFQVSSVSAASGFIELLNPPKSTAQPQARRGSSATDLPELSDTDRAAAILGIRRNPTSDEVNASYRHLAQMYHPDKVAALAPEFQALAEQKMKEINWAYSLLKEARS